MKGPLRFGVLGCSEFAGRSMIPALQRTPEVAVAAVASRQPSKGRAFGERFGCAWAADYEALLRREDVEAVYISVPNALHAEWAIKALEAGKHVLIEKPLAWEESAAATVIKKAGERGLLLVENILFPHHSQFEWTRRFLESGELGEVRLYRTTFTIGALKTPNIRYDAALGGGALLDLGPYMVRFAAAFAGPRPVARDVRIAIDSFRGVDLYGACQFVSGDGRVAQAAWGFDSHYQCRWEFIGEKGKLVVERAYSAPAGFSPVVRLERGGACEMIELPPDDQAGNMARAFARSVREGAFEQHWAAVEDQAAALSELRRLAQS